MDRDARWVTADFRIGDVVFFPMLTFHGSLVNTVPGKLRLNADVRYQPASRPMDPRYSATCLVDAQTQAEIIEQHAPDTSRAERLRENEYNVLHHLLLLPG